MLNNDVLQLIYRYLHNLYINDICIEIKDKIVKSEVKAMLLKHHNDDLSHDTHNIMQKHTYFKNLHTNYLIDLNRKFQYIHEVLTKELYWVFDDELYKFKVGYCKIKKFLKKHNAFDKIKYAYDDNDRKKWYTQVMCGMFINQV